MPPVFFEGLLHDDMAVAERQTGGRNFDGSLLRGVSRRCRHGFPQVVVCSPLRNGLPFPTAFWLTCPHLSHRADVLESSGGVTEMGEQLDEERHDEWAIFSHEHALFRVFLLGPAMAVRLREVDPAAWESLTCTGAGGIRMKGTFSMKCLHLQTASMIGLGWHPVGEWLMSRLGDLECGDPEEWPCAKERDSER